MKAEAQEEARRWEEEQEAEIRRKEAMKLSEDERLDILQVFFCFVKNIQQFVQYKPSSILFSTPIRNCCW